MKTFHTVNGVPSSQNSFPIYSNFQAINLAFTLQYSVLIYPNVFYPKPAVIFNPKRTYGEEENFGDLSSFVGSLDVIYSFMRLEVRGVLSKRRGLIFKCVRDGVVSGERWKFLVEEEGELKVVSTFKARPSIGEVETVLYNLMAINSPITKSGTL